MRVLCNLETVNTYEGTHDIHALVLGRAGPDPGVHAAFVFRALQSAVSPRGFHFVTTGLDPVVHEVQLSVDCRIKSDTPNTKLFSRAPASELCLYHHPSNTCHPAKKPREAERRKRRIRPVNVTPRHQTRPKALRARCPHPTLPRTRERAGRGLPALHRGARQSDRTLRLSPGRQVRGRGRRRSPVLSIVLKRSTRPRSSAGGDLKTCPGTAIMRPV